MPSRFPHGVAGAVTASTAVVNASPFNKVWYVDATIGLDSTANGQNPLTPYLTIGAAISAAAAGDTIIIGPGTYTITSALSPKARQHLTAAVICFRAPTVSITSTTLADLITVDVAGVRFTGLEFLGGNAANNNLVNVASVASVNGVIFDRCVFNGADKTSLVGINAAHATNTTTGLTVVDCLFRDLTGTHINVGVQGIPYGYICYNQFALDINSGTAIALADTTAFATGKGYEIGYNVFTGFDATADEVGITIAGTENTTGAGIIHDNRFAYIAATGAITIDKLSLSEVSNIGASASSGAVAVSVGS